jgi:hypothetical protein
MAGLASEKCTSFLGCAHHRCVEAEEGCVGWGQHVRGTSPAEVPAPPGLMMQPPRYSRVRDYATFGGLLRSPRPCPYCQHGSGGFQPPRPSTSVSTCFDLSLSIPAEVMSPICHFRTGVCRGCGDRRQHRGAQQLDSTYSETCLVGLNMAPHCQHREYPSSFYLSCRFLRLPKS